MNRLFFSIMLVVFAASGFADERQEIELVYSGNGDSHCYDIYEHEGMRLKFLTLGKNYSATPIADTVNVDVTKHPAGWQANVITNSRYGQRYVEMKPDKMPEREGSDKSSRRLGEICLRFGDAIGHVEQLPYSYEVVTSSRVTAARATPGKSAVSATAPESVKDGLEKAEDALEKIDRLKDIIN